MFPCPKGDSELFGEWGIRPTCTVIPPREMGANKMGVEFHGVRFVTKGNLTSCYLNNYLAVLSIWVLACDVLSLNKVL